MDNKKLIAITGASSGIGAATAKAFSEAGYPLLLMARRIELMEAMNLPNAICKEVDVLDLEGMKAAISEAEDAHGEVDCM
nr:SDR family NAD(P)-dependent oxidoreductase [Dehalococcoidia bacterium]